MTKAQKPDAPVKAVADTVTVEVLSPITSGGVRFEVGELIDGLTREQAQSVIDVGAAKLAD